MIRKSKRKGMTSFMEAVICLAIFTAIISSLLQLLSGASGWVTESQITTEGENDYEFLMNSLQTDIKSAEELSSTDRELEVRSKESLITYHFYGENLFRENETVMTGIQNGMFASGGEDSVGIYIRTKDGSIIDCIISR